MEFTATMLPTGEMRDIKVSEATVNAMKALPGADQAGDLTNPDHFKSMLSSIVFPAGAVVKGNMWSHLTEGKSLGGKISTEHVFTFDGPVDQEGARLDKISFKQNVKVEADPKATIKVKSIKATGHALFDNKAGRLVECTTQQTMTGKLDVAGLPLDKTSEQTTTIRLQKQTAEAKSAAARDIEAIKIDETEFVEKVVATDLLETLAGVSRSFTVERSYEPSITITGSVPVSDDLKTKVEKALDITIGKKMLVKESITLDGKEITKVNVQWVERYRRGTATTSNGTTLSFLVKVGLRFKLEKAK
jgi:hypothetical protein